MGEFGCLHNVLGWIPCGYHGITVCFRVKVVCAERVMNAKLVCLAAGFLIFLFFRVFFSPTGWSWLWRARAGTITHVSMSTSESADCLGPWTQGPKCLARSLPLSYPLGWLHWVLGFCSHGGSLWSNSKLREIKWDRWSAGFPESGNIWSITWLL